MAIYYIFVFVITRVICPKFQYAGKRSLGRPRHRWEDNIRMDLEVVGVNMRNWIDSA